MSTWLESKQRFQPTYLITYPKRLLKIRAELRQSKQPFGVSFLLYPSLKFYFLFSNKEQGKSGSLPLAPASPAGSSQY